MSYTVEKRVLNAWMRWTPAKWGRPAGARRWIEDEALPGLYRVLPLPKPRGGLKHLATVVVGG